jgi:hypothetical protein
MRYRTFSRTAGIVFLLTACAHAVRVLMAVPLTVAAWPVPQWASAAAALFVGYLGFEGMRQSRGNRG